jgi:hypothetical protein
LVTDDRQLPWVNSLLACEDNTGIFTVELSHLDPRLAREAVRLLARNQIARVAGAGSWPDWDRCAGAASALERELGIHDAPELRLDPPVRRVTLEMSDIEAYLSALECGTAESALTRVAECDGDAFLGGVVALERLVVDNASVRGRAASDSWGAAIDSLGPKASELWMVQLAVQLPRAMAEERWPLFNALMGKLSAEGGAGFVFLFLWRLGRIVLEDTAVARSTTIEDLVALLQRKAKSSERDSQPDAGGEPNSRTVE